MTSASSEKMSFKRVMVLLVGVIAAVIGAGIGGAVAKRAVGSLFGTAVTVEEALEQAAIEINKKTPLQVDPWTRLDKAVVRPGKTLAYQYTLVNVAQLPSSPQFVQQLRPGLVNNYQTKTEMAEMRKQGVTLVYEYLDPQGKNYAQIVILATDTK